MGTSIIFHSAPEDVAWAISGNLGDAHFNTDPADLNNGRPAERTEIEWGSGAQTTGSVLELQAFWLTPQPVRGIVIRDLSAPVGAKVRVWGMRDGDGDYTYNLGGNSQSQNVFEFADGSTGLVVVCPTANDDLVGVQVELWNDLGGSTYIAASELVYLGDVDFYQGYEPPDAVEYDWTFGFANVGSDERTSNVQPHKRKTRPYGVLNVSFTYAPFTIAFGNSGAPTAMDYDKIAHRIAFGDKCGVITRYTQTGSSNLDPWGLHRTSIFGVASNIQRPSGQGSNFFRMSFVVNEAPAGN